MTEQPGQSDSAVPDAQHAPEGTAEEPDALGHVEEQELIPDEQSTVAEPGEALEELLPALQATGHDGVDDALATLDEMAEKSVDEHVDVFDAGARRLRLDAELVRRGAARSREHARDLVAGGRVSVNAIRAAKPASVVAVDDDIVVREDPDRPEYASRGGHKLAGALTDLAPLGLDLAGRRVLDAGASTGGFTDVALRSGAASVLAVDVGYGQLVWELRQDPRVEVHDRTNIRELDLEVTGGPVDAVVGDLSFISLRLVLDALIAVLEPEGDLLLMVKPQFEVGRERLGKGGVVRSATDRADAVRSVVEAADRRGWGARAATVSALPGPAGNVEFFAPGTPAALSGPGERVSAVSNVRRVLVVTHTGRDHARQATLEAVRGLRDAGLRVRLLAQEARDLGLDDALVELVAVADEADAARGCEVAVVIGGDGTILRAAEIARHHDVPLLGVNLGHVGFLAEAEPEDLPVTIRAIVERTYLIEDRLTLEVDVRRDGAVVWSTWALNEASVEKSSRQRMLEVGVAIDGEPLSRWGCDGVVCATPTGSTAYNFSAGGPVVWPDVEALLLVPISAHALFARPLVVGPHSAVLVEVQAADGVVWCDGRRSLDLGPGDRVEVRRGSRPVRLARLHRAPFSDRLVAKFGLPVEGWRGAAERRHRRAEEGDS
ncbi:hypothetical protein LUZ63_020596 [Rhynchospora breviuscula]|uniref:RNA-binding S4 domain-containing protein n=1 Tax=Rhynchospora breviuscula TaxID=2022672 RepID=A0A9Q0C0S5_9POAL|nr:hypothetical protein LUZ63_020596 [Rhynchospora breviuscula]